MPSAANTLRSPVFRKLLLSAFVVIATALFVSDFYVTRYTAQRQQRMIQQQLAVGAHILAGELPRPDLHAWVTGAEARSQARVTIIDPTGAVLADSQHDSSTMENHAGRPEVRQAVSAGEGIAIRHSATLNRDLCYLAVRLSGGSVLRLAIPLRDIDASIAEVRRRILQASLLALVLALVLAFLFSRSFSGRIRRLQSFAEGIFRPGFSGGGLQPEADDELGSLARSLDRMAAEWRDLIEKLSIESRRRESILAGMVEGVLAVDGEMRVIFCNQAFAGAVGASMPVQERLPLLELVRDAGLLDLLARVLIRGEPDKQVLRLSAARERSFEVHASALTSGSRRGAIAVLHDITDIERLERVRKDFVANVSHELRTPLAAIRGYAETLLDGALEDPENNRKFLGIILANATRLNNIASDLLALSELESDRPEPEQKPFAVREALESALGAVEPEARMREVRLVRGPIDDARVMGSRMRLEQVFVNLLDNAVKFNRPGGEVRLEARRTPEGAIEVSISDTGVGIPSEHLPRIFERFYRVDRSRSRAVGGTGLGLSIVKHAVERMNGSVAVESQ
ncbi:MAG: PAS domain-containing protein, partial [Acidobacteriia bacterium]|nr:PAS domain-containing protein [Terriglobia bacterium]